MTTLWLKRLTLQITSIPLLQRVPFSCQQSFCWNRRPIFKRWISHCEMKLFRGRIRYLLWLHLTVKQLEQLSDYCFPIRERSSLPLIFLHLGNKIKAKERKRKKRCAHEKCLIHELILFISHTPWCLIHVFMQMRVISEDTKEKTQNDTVRNLIRLEFKEVRYKIFRLLCLGLPL